MSNQPTVLLGSTLNVAAKTVTLPFTPADPELILLVINKTRGATYYDPENPALLGTLSGGNILTFVASTAGHNNADILEVWYAGPWPDDMLSNTIGIQSAVASINGKTPALDGGKVPVTDTVVQTKLDTIAGKQDAQTGLLTTIEANQLVIGDLSTLATAARQDTGNGYLQSLANDPATGTKQDAQSVLLTAISGKDFSTSAKQDTGNAAIVAVNTSIGTTNTEIGGLTETAPATDTASSGLNGRLQRIAQRLTTLITNLGTWVFGAGTAAAAARVTLASDDPAVATLGATSGAAVITDANGTVQQYLRGLVKQWIAGTLVIGTGSNVIGKTYIAYQTSKALTSAAISTTTSGEQTIVSGTASQTIRVFRLSFTVSAATTVTIKDAAGGNTLASYDLVANGSLILEATDGEPYFVTASAGAFIISSSATANIKGNIQYTKS